MQIDDAERRGEDPAEFTNSTDQEAIDVTGAGMETSGETEAEAGGSPAPASETDDGEDVEGEPDAELLAAAEAVLGLPPDRTRGHYVMDPAALRAEVGDRVDPSEDEPTSSEEAARITRLQVLAADPDGLYRSHLVADEAMVARLAAVRARAPHAVDALDIVIGAARLSLRTRTPIEIPPIVLLGPPGCGKSWIVRELGKALGISTLSLLGSPTRFSTAVSSSPCGHRDPKSVAPSSGGSMRTSARGLVSTPPYRSMSALSIVSTMSA